MLLAVSEGGHSSNLALTALCLIGFVFIHLYSGKLLFLEQIPRSRWLSAASGASVAYVFVHVLPDLSKHQEAITNTGMIGFLEYHVYLMALVGLAVFYGLERMVMESQSQKPDPETGTTAGLGVFWVHMLAFSLYNALIGYLLVQGEEKSPRSLLMFFIALGLHFVINDFGLRTDHRSTYHRVGRWILAGAIALGWMVGAGTEISEAAIAVLFAFVAGAIILNVLKEELPEERQSRFWAFALGAAAYSVLLLALAL
ncbi:MAG: hypothetical protein ACFB4I_06310 [Cyanophyceae cyanobacterium]